MRVRQREWEAIKNPDEKNIYQRNDGRFEARFIKDRDENGKVIYGYVYGSSFEEAKRKRIDASAPKITFGQALDNWLIEVKGRVKESAYVKYYYTANYYVKPALGHYAPADITDTVKDEFAAALIKDGNGKGGVSEQQFKSVFTVVNAVLEIEHGRKRFNIEALSPEKETKNIRAMTKEEQTRLEDYLTDNKDAKNLGILLCLYTGVQLGELCALRWGDIRIEGEKAVLTVRRNLQRVAALESDSAAKTKIIEMAHKPPLLRTIPVPECLTDMLKDYQRTDETAYLLSGSSSGFIEPRNMEYYLKRCLKNCLTAPVNFRSIRYTFVARSIEGGIDLMELSFLLGYSDIKSTLNALRKCNANLPGERLRIKGYEMASQA